MRKLLCILIAALMLMTFSACAGHWGEPESSAPAPVADLQEEALIAAVKTNLGVPDKAGITYSISKKYYWEAAERYCVDVTFSEYGDTVAGASVDPTSGELLQNIWDYTAPVSTPMRDAFIRVLDGEQNFVVKTWSGGKVEKKNLNHFAFATEFAELNVFVPDQYTFVDMDRDRVFELVVLDAKRDFFLILRYDGGQVRGYMVPYRGLMGLRVDGRFKGTEGAGISSIGSMTFNGPEYIVTELAYQDQQKEEYRLDGAASDKASVETYYTSWEKVEQVKWIQFES